MENGVSEESTEKIINFISIKGSSEEILESLSNLNIENEVFNEGHNELKTVVEYIEAFGVDKKNFAVDLKIARGLDYYTGTVYETTLDDYPKVGSVCSGGRYENLASFYTDMKLPGVGISIGLSRLFYQLNEAKIIKSQKKSLVDVMVIPMEEQMLDAIKLVSELREKGVKVVLYTEKAKMGKKFKYADNLDIPYTVVVGEQEVKDQKFSLKNMQTGEQEEFSIDEIVEKLK